MKTTIFDVDGGRGVKAECGCAAVLGEFTVCPEHERDFLESLRNRRELLELAAQAQLEWAKQWLYRVARNVGKSKDEPHPFLPEFGGE
jgi:hypothetical protein